MNDLKVFQNETFGQVRTIEENGKVLFCGKDVAKALGYANTTDALNRHCKYVVKRDTPHPQSETKTIPMRFIPEGDLYRLITNSELPTAEKFESWVFDDVLPSIRKTGSYELPKSTTEMFRLALGSIEETNAKVEAVNADLQEFKLDMPILGLECDKITSAVKKKGVECLCGKGSRAYQDNSLRNKIYSDIYNQLKREFGIASYKAIKRSQSDLAINIINAYKLPLALAEQVCELNQQLQIS